MTALNKCTNACVCGVIRMMKRIISDLVQMEGGLRRNKELSNDLYWSRLQTKERENLIGI